MCWFKIDIKYQFQVKVDYKINIWVWLQLCSHVHRSQTHKRTCICTHTKNGIWFFVFFFCKRPLTHLLLFVSSSARLLNLILHNTHTRTHTQTVFSNWNSSFLFTLLSKLWLLVIKFSFAYILSIIVYAISDSLL